MRLIRWDLVDAAIRAYSTRYSYLEVPWIVSEEALAVTLPPGREGTRCDDGPLVGSAEQSFVQLMLDGEMPVGRYMAATPCFRDDDEDDLHQRHFFKVELIQHFDGKCPSIDAYVHLIMSDALEFYASLTPGVKAVQTGEHTWDLELNGIELGSYGYRELGIHAWTYGTGFAEPRFSTALAKTVDGGRSSDIHTLVAIARALHIQFLQGLPCKADTILRGRLSEDVRRLSDSLERCVENGLSFDLEEPIVEAVLSLAGVHQSV